MMDPKNFETPGFRPPREWWEGDSESCPDPAWFLDYSEGTLTPELAEECQRKLSEDPGLARRYQAYLRVAEGMKALKQGKGRSGLRERILEAIREGNENRDGLEAEPVLSSARVLAFVASISIAAAALLFFFVLIRNDRKILSREHGEVSDAARPALRVLEPVDEVDRDVDRDEVKPPSGKASPPEEPSEKQVPKKFDKGVGAVPGNGVESEGAKGGDLFALGRRPSPPSKGPFREEGAKKNEVPRKEPEKPGKVEGEVASGDRRTPGKTQGEARTLLAASPPKVTLLEFVLPEGKREEGEAALRKLFKGIRFTRTSPQGRQGGKKRARSPRQPGDANGEEALFQVSLTGEELLLLVKKMQSLGGVLKERQILASESRKFVKLPNTGNLAKAWKGSGNKGLRSQGSGGRGVRDEKKKKGKRLRKVETSPPASPRPGTRQGKRRQAPTRTKKAPMPAKKQVFYLWLRFLK